MEWHPNGRLKAHGQFVIRSDGRSVPDGVWSFWDERGRIEARASYEAGGAACFVVWDEHGEPQSFELEVGALVVSECEIIDDAEASATALRYEPSVRFTKKKPRFSVSIGSMRALGDMPVRADDPMISVVSLTSSMRLSASRRRGPMWLGLGAEYWSTTQPSGWSGALSALLSWRSSSPIDWLDVEVSAESGIRQYSILPMINSAVLTTPARFKVPFAGARAGVELELHRAIRLTASVFFSRDVARTRVVSYRTCEEVCVFCVPRCTDWNSITWRVGGTTAGAGLALRFSVD